MKTLYVCFALVIFLMSYSSVALADHPTIAFGNEVIGAINTISAKTLPVGTWGFGLRTEYITNDEFSNEQLENFAQAGFEGVHSIDNIMNTSVSLSYGATENISISVRLPYIKRKNIRESEVEDGTPEAHIHGDSSGVGDLLLLSHYRIQKRTDLDVAILFGVKLPTGQTDEKDNDGIRFETEFQPGTGSWDLLLGAAISKNRGKFEYHANILYNFTTEGAQSTEIGDVFSYNAALGYKLTKSKGLKWVLSVELNGETRQKNKILGISEDNSGGTIVYISPGFRVSSKNLSGFVSYGMPVVENYNGKQTDVNYRIVAGASFAF